MATTAPTGTAAPNGTATPAVTTTPAPTATASPSAIPPGTATLSVPQYRAKLETAATQIAALKNHHPRPLGPILNKLDVTVLVRRADGKTQLTRGNQWANLSRQLQNGKDAKREDVAKAAEMLKSSLGALDEWTAQPSYVSADAQKIEKDLEKSGQIRVGPLWWQKRLSDAWKSFAKGWAAFIKWLTGWMPTPVAPKNVSMPDTGWLWMLFYAFVAVVLVAVGWFVYKAFGSGWSFRRRAARRQEELQGEDAQLLLLPPAELRSRADDFAAQGNFREALRHRYLALLVQLDSRGVWRYDTRRTNWEHIAALRRQENKQVLVAPLSELTRRFDRVRYGGAPCDVEQWQQFDQDARQFESLSSPFEVAGSAR